MVLSMCAHTLMAKPQTNLSKYTNLTAVGNNVKVNKVDVDGRRP